MKRSQAGQYALIPENLADWRMQVDKINGEVICTARRTGVTLLIVKGLDGWWTVTKWHKGREIYTKRVKHLPYGGARTIEQEGRRQSHAYRQRSKLGTSRAVQ